MRHHRRALGDREFDIVGHAHRKRIEAEPCAQPLIRPMNLPIALARAPARESPSVRAGAAAAARHDPSQILHCRERHALLVASPDAFTWMSTFSAGQRGGPLLERRRAIFHGERLHPLETSAASRVLLLWSGPIRCHSRPGSAVIFSNASCT